MVEPSSLIWAEGNPTRWKGWGQDGLNIPPPESSRVPATKKRLGKKTLFGLKLGEE
jgi:hypothetical protein